MSAFIWGTVCVAWMKIEATRDHYPKMGHFDPPRLIDWPKSPHQLGLIYFVNFILFHNNKYMDPLIFLLFVFLWKNTRTDGSKCPSIFIDYARQAYIFYHDLSCGAWKSFLFYTRSLTYEVFKPWFSQQWRNSLLKHKLRNLRDFLRLWKNNRVSRKPCKQRIDLVLNGQMKVPK